MSPADLEMLSRTLSVGQKVEGLDLSDRPRETRSPNGRRVLAKNPPLPFFCPGHKSLSLLTGT